MSSEVSNNYKMDFIDPGRNGTGMLSARNTVKEKSGLKNNTDYCKRYIELTPNIATGKNQQH